MNKTLETIRGSWITRDREAAETNRNILCNSIDRIPDDLRDKFLSALEWAERIETSSDAIVDATAKYEESQLNELIFLEDQMKKLLQAIWQTRDVDSIKALRTAARETIDQISDHRLRQEQARLQYELSSRKTTSPSPTTAETSDGRCSEWPSSHLTVAKIAP